MFTVNENYTEYRIPAMAVSDDGEIYIAYECRSDPSDWAKIDIRLMKSGDGGESFTQCRMLEGNGETLNNPLWIAYGNTLHFFYCKNYSRVFHIQSGDGGKTWSYPDEMTAVFADLAHTVVAVGPGHGIVTPDGTFVAPVWLAYDPEDKQAHRPSFLTTVYSKDKGKTWRHGAVITQDDLVDPNETAIALSKDGSVILSIRNRHPEIFCRYCAVSPNGYEAWQYPGFDERMIDPRCMGSMCNGDGLLFFSNCESKEDRVELTLKVSRDDFATFKRILISEEGGYSDIAFWHGMVYILYETSQKCDDMRKNHILHFRKIEIAGFL